MKIKKANCETYSWGQRCTAWHLVNNNELSIIQELMPSGTEEIKHKHSKSQQFFYILKGEATFIIETKEYKAIKNQGIHILPNIVHQIKNQASEDLEFLVISQPHSHGDRINEDIITL